MALGLGAIPWHSGFFFEFVLPIIRPKCHHPAPPKWLGTFVFRASVQVLVVQLTWLLASPGLHLGAPHGGDCARRYLRRGGGGVTCAVR